MGEDLWRQYLALAELGRGDDLALLKEKSNQLEVKWSEAGRRRINLDPGFVDVDKLVLASTKSASHRLPIGRGIYAESTLRFEYGRFEPWPYTYPDYRQDLAIEFFSRVRRRLKAQRRARRAGRRGGR
jgi:hypothetical protein